MNFGHLWYIEHVPIYSLVYAGIRTLRRPGGVSGTCGKGPPRHGAILLFALGTAVASGVVRIWYPIARWVGLLGFIQVAFADLPRDLGFFLVGMLAYRRQWLQGLPNEIESVWMGVGLGASILWTVYVLGISRVVRLGDVTTGIVHPIWEALLCCGMCIGLPALFRRRLDWQGAWGRALARNQYAAYLFHVPVIVVCQYAATFADWPPLTRFVVVTAVGVPTTFLLSHAIRQIRPLRAVI